jgi:hypothetical protein
MFGISGAHRTGKSTLAQRYADAFKIPYLKLPNVMQELGVTPAQVSAMGLADRLKVQWVYLHAAAKLYKEHNQGIFITDRTPLDMAAYTLADIRQDSHPALAAQVTVYVEQALKLTNQYFGLIMFVPPGIPYVDEPGKPPANPAYQELISAIIQGLLVSERCTVQYQCMGRAMTDPERRWKAMLILHEHLCRQMAGAVAGMTAQ